MRYIILLTIQNTNKNAKCYIVVYIKTKRFVHKFSKLGYQSSYLNYLCDTERNIK